MTTHDSDTQNALLAQCLETSLGITDPQRVADIRASAVLVSVLAGQFIMRQGDASDAMYLIVSGRLRAQVQRDESGQPLAKPMVFGEMGRGELIGEIGVINAQARTADVLVVRDSVLLKMQATDFLHWLQATPDVSLAVMRRMVERLTKNSASRATATAYRQPFVNVCVLPLTARAAALAPAFATAWSRPLSQALGLTCLADTIVMAKSLAGTTPASPELATKDVRVIHLSNLPTHLQSDSEKMLYWLNEQESSADLLVLVADAQDSPWTRLCLRHADRIALLACANDATELHPLELQLAQQLSHAQQSLILLHPEDCKHPSNTRAWLQARPHLAGTLREPKAVPHHHVRLGWDPDLARLARIFCGRSVGLVFSGGGARGFCEFGIWQALVEAGVPIDMVGGTSIGAIVAGYVATDMVPLKAQAQAHTIFSQNPTRDVNWLPFLSLIRGKRLQDCMRQAVALGFDHPSSPPCIEDTWLPYFCVASNYSQAQMQVLRMGDLAKSMQASASIPAALPPVVWEGDLLVDGGLFNNYPVDIMREQGAAWVVGVNLQSIQYQKLTIQEIPHPAMVLWDKWTRKKKNRRYQGVPNIAATVFNIAVMTGVDHQKRMDALVDLGFAPPLSGTGMLDWNAFSDMVQRGLHYGRVVLLTQGLLKALT